MAKASSKSIPLPQGVNRRGILLNSVVCLASVAASTAAIARPVDVLQDDPIYATIARQIETEKAESQAVKVSSEAEQAFLDKFGAMHPDAFSRECREGLAAIDPKFQTSPRANSSQTWFSAARLGAEVVCVRLPC